MNTRETNMIIGLLIWLGLLAGGIMLIQRTSAKAPGGIQRLVHYVSSERFDVDVQLESAQPIAVGDLVFLEDQSHYAPIGFVSRVGNKESKTRDVLTTATARITFYGDAPQFTEHDQLKYHLPSEDMAWVMETMFPPAKREEITKLILEAYARDREAIIDAMRPIVAKSLSDATAIVREDLQAAFAKREEQIKQIGIRYQHELVEEQLVPLVRDEIWPIIQEESQPLAEQIGQEVWKEISLFRFGWRYIYDRSVGPEQSLTERELNRFLERKVQPILENHFQEMVEVQNAIVAKVSRNERVRETFTLAVRKIASDPEIQHLIHEIFQEVLINNERLRVSLEQNWNSPAALAAVRITKDRLEPTITGIGVALFGSTSTEITPEFARVLRHRILHKDSRWFTLRVSNPDPPTQSAGRSRRPKTLTAQVAHPPGNAPYAPARAR